MGSDQRQERGADREGPQEAIPDGVLEQASFADHFLWT